MSIKRQFAYADEYVIALESDLSEIYARRVSRTQVIRISGRKLENKVEILVSSANPRRQNTEESP